MNGYYKFIGRDSLDYRHGRVYYLIVKRRRFWHAFAPKCWQIWIDIPFFCPYKSLEKFNENWERVK